VRNRFARDQKERGGGEQGEQTERVSESGSAERQFTTHKARSLSLSLSLCIPHSAGPCCPTKTKQKQTKGGEWKSPLTCLFALRCFNGQQKITQRLCWSFASHQLIVFGQKSSHTPNSLPPIWTPQKAFAPCATPINKQRANRWQHCVRSFCAFPLSLGGVMALVVVTPSPYRRFRYTVRTG